MVKSKNAVLGLFFVSALFLQACAHRGAEDKNMVPQTQEISVSSPSIDDQSDKLERFNRFSFEFNNKLDKYMLKPLAKGYRKITNQYTRDRVNNIFSNFREPVSLVNNLLQGNFVSGSKNVGRFALNSTLGLAGMYDVAGGGFGISSEFTSFDETMADYCVKDGPFIVLPFVGPTTPREFVGRSVDGFANPVFIATYSDANTRDKILLPYAVLLSVANRESSLDLIDDVEKSSVDFYATVRSAYLQNRKKIKPCGIVSDKSDEPKLDFDVDMDDDEL